MQRYNEITPVQVIKRDDRQYFRGVAIAAYDGTEKTQYELPAKNGRRRVERISRQAIEGLAGDHTDTELRVDHNRQVVLGNKSSGMLETMIGEQGLLFENEYKQNDPDHVKTMAKIENKICRGCSFMAGEWEENWTAEKDYDVCTITKLADLEDVSICRKPAYSGSAVILRNDETRNEDAYNKWQATKTRFEKIDEMNR